MELSEFQNNIVFKNKFENFIFEVEKKSESSTININLKLDNIILNV